MSNIGAWILLLERWYSIVLLKWNTEVANGTKFSSVLGQDYLVSFLSRHEPYGFFCLGHSRDKCWDEKLFKHQCSNHNITASMGRNAVWSSAANLCSSTRAFQGHGIKQRHLCWIIFLSTYLYVKMKLFCKKHFIIGPCILMVSTFFGAREIMSHPVEPMQLWILYKLRPLSIENPPRLYHFRHQIG